MKNTKNQTTTKTLADLYRSIDRKNAVTVSFLKEEKDDTGKKTGRFVETVRTLEPYDLITTIKGDIVLKAMDRESGEARTVRVDRMISYTLHRSAFIVERSTDDAPAHPAPSHSAAALIAYELNRDTITAAWRAHLALAA